jgi:hypothetical protein
VTTNSCALPPYFRASLYREAMPPSRESDAYVLLKWGAACCALQLTVRGNAIAAAKCEYVDLTLSAHLTCAAALCDGVRRV